MTTNKRERLIDSAAILFHHNSLAATSLADIAKHADIPIGNVYYYFKTKEELALAAVNKRREHFNAAYAALEEKSDNPRQRLIESMRYFENLSGDYARYGCPIGKMINDSPVERDSVIRVAAEVLEAFVVWAERQFRQLGHNDDARRYAVSLMAGIQGAAVMAKAGQDAGIMHHEIERLAQWIETIPNRRIQLGKVSAKLGTLSNAA